MAARKCPNCEDGKLTRISTSTNKTKEYQVVYWICDDCSEKHQTCEMPNDRAQELLNYERAYWKMKEIINKYY